jgi:hypothetical protein
MLERRAQIRNAKFAALPHFRIPETGARRKSSRIRLHQLRQINTFPRFGEWTCGYEPLSLSPNGDCWILWARAARESI